jgi:hypothetical protein
LGVTVSLFTEFAIDGKALPVRWGFPVATGAVAIVPLVAEFSIGGDVPSAVGALPVGRGVVVKPPFIESTIDGDAPLVGEELPVATGTVIIVLSVAEFVIGGNAPSVGGALPVGTMEAAFTAVTKVEPKLMLDVVDWIWEAGTNSSVVVDPHTI